MKKVLKFFLIVFVYIVVYIASNAVMPFSQAFREIAAETSSLSGFFLFICCCAFICFTICYIVAKSRWRGAKCVAGISFVVFMTASFMTQIETLFFGSAFPVLTKTDIFSIMLVMLPPIFIGVKLGVVFFGEREPAEKSDPIRASTLVPIIAILGLIYAAIYFLFGYFVAWQFEELRVFYSGSAENAGFIGVLINNAVNDPIIYPFQFVRGIMFVSFSLPLLYMTREKGRKNFIISVCLTYLITAVLLVIPNALFPDVVRWAHFIEMTSSMLIFGIITGFGLWRSRY